MPDLLNIGFTIVEIGWFYGGEHLGMKRCRFLTCFHKITSRWRFSTGMATCENISNTGCVLLMFH